jgi:hypothetical protein
MVALQLATLCYSGGYAAALQLTTLRLATLCCSYGGDVACNIAIMAMLQLAMLWHCKEANVFFFLTSRLLVLSTVFAFVPLLLARAQ